MEDLINKNMRIALAQTQIIWEKKEQNLAEAEKILRNCSADEVDFVLFPEMSFTGFSMNTELTTEDSGYTIKQVSEFAKVYNICIGFGWVKKLDRKNSNCYTIIDNTGKLLNTYAKIHPFSYSGEDKKFLSGDTITKFSIKNIVFTNFICYDLRFPELFRSVADEVHAIIVPACWPAKRSEHWKTLLRARAIENQVYIFAINCSGNIGGLYYSGDSCVINPNGDAVEMLSDKEGVIIYDFKDDVIKYRKQFPVLNDRRNELYKKITKT